MNQPPNDRTAPPGAPRVGVIGAGSSGLIAAKTLRERGLRVAGYELGSDVGGLWQYGNDSGRSPAYRSLRTNTSRERTGYACFPLPDGVPAYPLHSDLLRHFEAFADRFGLRAAFSFRTRVERVEPDAGGGWRVRARDLESGGASTARHDAVVVASGHHWDPALPAFPGHLDGLALHSFHYRSPEILEGRRVLVVGIGNSACDIACEAAGVARRVLLSTRRGAHVLPKFLLGRPLDHWIGPITSRLPFAAQRLLLATLMRLGRGDQERFGVPKPRHRLGEEHPTISQELPELVRRGAIEIKPDVAELAGDRVRFADGTEAKVDVAVWATGYRVSFPFLDPEVVRVRGNRVPLYLHVVPPERPGLYFLGLVQPLGALPPLAEAQAEWVADLIDGRAALPPPDDMRRAIERAERELARRFTASRRHTMEVDFFPYLREVARERARGRRRAAPARGGPRGREGRESAGDPPPEPAHQGADERRDERGAYDGSARVPSGSGRPVRVARKGRGGT